MPTTATRPINRTVSAFQAHPATPNLRTQGLPIPPREDRGAAPLPAPARSTRPRARMQTAWLVVMVIIAMVVVAIGLAYLSGYALVAKEGFRQAQIQHMLNTERELQQQWKTRLAQANAPAWIEHLARANGMIRAEANDVLTLGAPSPDSISKDSISNTEIVRRVEHKVRANQSRRR